MKRKRRWLVLLSFPGAGIAGCLGALGCTHHGQFDLVYGVVVVKYNVDVDVPVARALVDKDKEQESDDDIPVVD